MQISGTSLINHKIRVKLKLTLAEYCVMQFLFDWYSIKKKKPGIEDFYVGLGINQKVLHGIIGKLAIYGFLQPDLIITDKWKNEFRLDIQDFERLWLLLPKGNKTKAKQRFLKVLKLIAIDELETKLKNYVAYCDRCGVIKKNIDTWLNPATQCWNDPLFIDKTNKPKEEEKPKGIPFFITD